MLHRDVLIERMRSCLTVSRGLLGLSLILTIGAIVDMIPNWIAIPVACSIIGAATAISVRVRRLRLRIEEFDAENDVVRKRIANGARRTSGRIV